MSHIYTPSNISFISAHFTETSPSQRLAAAWAAICHQLHSDGSDLATQTPNGLHPMYIALHGRGDANDVEIKAQQEVLNDTFNDVLDALTTLDRIDGGISLLIRSPGFTVSTDSGMNDITLSTYLTSRAMTAVDARDMLQEVLVAFTQIFGKEVVLPHLHQFTKRCELEGVNATFEPIPGIRLRAARPYIRFPKEHSTGYNAIECVPFDFLPVRIESRKPLPSRQRLKSIIGAAFQLCQLGPMVSSGAQTGDSDPTPVSDQPILRFGAETDIALDYLELPDILIPHLHKLARTVRSSKWEKELHRPEWGLSLEQAGMLSWAMIQDSTVEDLKPGNKLVLDGHRRAAIPATTVAKQNTATPGPFYGSAPIIPWHKRATIPAASVTKPNSARSPLPDDLIDRHQLPSAPIPFYKAQQHPATTNPPRRINPGLKLTREGWAELNARRKELKLDYDAALEKAWKNIEETIAQIAADHKKSPARFKAQGKDRLPEVSRILGPEYKMLTQEEKDQLVSEMEQARATKARGRRVSARSKVNDMITNSIAVIENEFLNLNARTGAEAVFFITRGTSDVAFRNVSFKTPGVTNFLETTMKIDSNQLLSKMEGYALSGFKGLYTPPPIPHGFHRDSTESALIPHC
ncbi:hypothetical protein F5887DRAFT_921664 [Amanita rubescens]|nr:hypothetical protein F5887DRAFT_921664 [Amanita rubescens]